MRSCATIISLWLSKYLLSDTENVVLNHSLFVKEENECKKSQPSTVWLNRQALLNTTDKGDGAFHAIYNAVQGGWLRTQPPNLGRLRWVANNSIYRPKVETGTGETVMYTDVAI